MERKPLADVTNSLQLGLGKQHSLLASPGDKHRRMAAGRESGGDRRAHRHRVLLAIILLERASCRLFDGKRRCYRRPIGVIPLIQQNKAYDNRQS